MVKNQKIQVTQLVGTQLGIKPDKDGFYFCNPLKKLNVYELTEIMELIRVALLDRLENKFNSI